jgi:hypothetical protein
MDSLDKLPKRKKMDMRYGMWNVRRLCRAGSLVSLAKELSKYRLDLMGVQEVRWDRGGTEPGGEYIFFNGNEELIICTLHQI